MASISPLVIEALEEPQPEERPSSSPSWSRPLAFAATIVAELGCATAERA
jgi:hypothetical protein